MLCAPDGQLVDSVVVDHVRDGGEGPAELTEDVLPLRRLLDPHVHKAVGAPVKIDRYHQNLFGK